MRAARAGMAAQSKKMKADERSRMRQGDEDELNEQREKDLQIEKDVKGYGIDLEQMYADNGGQSLNSKRKNEKNI